MKIKEKDEDFIVKEIPKFKKGKGEYNYFWLKKKNYTTIRAIRAVARALRVSKKRIGFAGNKDKNAITEQVISIWNVPKEKIESIRLKDIELKYIGEGKERITLGDLKGNCFEITARGRYNKKSLKERAAEIGKKGFPNYFGEQRFGAAGNTHLIGRAIVKGDFEKAVKEILIKSSENIESKKAAEFAKNNFGSWKEIIKKIPKHQSMEKSVLNWLINYPNDYAGALRVIPKRIRRIFIHAYQSWFWNKALEKTISSGKKYKKELPIPGYETRLSRDKFSRNIRQLLKKEKLELNNFKCKRMPELASAGGVRKSFINPGKMEVLTDKNMVKLSFTSEKGVYATTLLKELFDDGLE